MSSPPDIGSDEDRDAIQDVYEQYWWQARHVENQVWSFTRVWALILTAIFTILGTDLPDDAKAAAALFGAVLSLLGLFMVYSLRIPFLAFALTSEVIAIKEFGIDPGYRRFFSDGLDFRKSKTIDVPDILILVYSLVGTALIFFSLYIWIGFITALITAGISSTLIVSVYLRWIRPAFDEQKQKAYDQFEG